MFSSALGDAEEVPGFCSIISEIRSLKGNTKGALFIFAFRLAGIFSVGRVRRVLGLPITVAYRLIFQWILGIDIPIGTRLGFGVNVYHGHGLVVNRDCVIGRNVTLRQNTTIGCARDGGVSPVIEDNVDVGANVVVIGGIRIGANSVIGAGSVVTKDVPVNSVVVGNPARVVRCLK
jgi:serine acetyltransferase